MAKSELVLPPQLEAQKAQLLEELRTRGEAHVEFSIDEIKDLIRATIGANRALGAEEPEVMDAIPSGDKTNPSVRVVAQAKPHQKLGSVELPLNLGKVDVTAVDITLANSSQQSNRLAADIHSVKGKGFPPDALITQAAKVLIGGEGINGVMDARLGKGLELALSGSDYSLGPLTMPGREGQFGLRATLRAAK